MQLSWAEVAYELDRKSYPLQFKSQSTLKHNIVNILCVNVFHMCVPVYVCAQLLDFSGLAAAAVHIAWEIVIKS